MGQLASQPLMRKIWLAMKTFNVPITHPYIQSLTEFDLEFIEWSSLFDNPKFLKKFQNTVYDSEFDQWYEEALQEEEAAAGGDDEDEETPPAQPTATQNKTLPPDDDTFLNMGGELPLNAISGHSTADDPDDWKEVD